MSMLLAAASTAALAAELDAAGADRVIAYHSSAYRSQRLPSVAGLLPWASANEQTLTMLADVVAGVRTASVIATVCANDGLIPVDQMLGRVQRMGVAGVLNAPTVGFYEGTLRAVLEAEGLGRDSEIALISKARQVGLEAWAYVFDPDWARRAAEAGATGVIVHLGITGHPSPTDGPSCVAAAAGAGARRILLHGGELRTPEDLAAELARYPAHLARRVNGFMGASVFEHARRGGPLLRDWRAALSLENGDQSDER
ncbi:MAG: phosphoenolpyruvate hydrolase family protein [Microbacterium sp.]|uniref:phosphoenolpyruvate hydrolase family protein n=1 Tax=Microbacterium sp. TaxID=51671 RepID=UPI0039E49E88